MRQRFRARLHWPRGDQRGADKGAAEDPYVEIDTAELSGLFAAPAWLRALGIASWLLVGVAAFLAGAIWLLALTQTIVIPVIVAAIIASVVSPVVDFLHRHGVPRG